MRKYMNMSRKNANQSIDTNESELNISCVIPSRKPNHQSNKLHPQRVNLTVDLAKNKIQVVNQKSKINKYNFKEAQASNELKQCIIEFFKYSQKILSPTQKDCLLKLEKDTEFITEKGRKRQARLQLLHEKFKQFPINYLLYVYEKCVGIVDNIFSFLKQYGHLFKAPKIQIKQDQVIVKKIEQQPPKDQWIMVVENQYKRKKGKYKRQIPVYSYRQQREQIDLLYKYIHNLIATKYKVHNQQSKNDIQRKIDQTYSQIREISRRSIKYLIEKRQQQDPLWIDLHGLREEQVYIVLDLMKDMIVGQFKKRSYKVRTQTQSFKTYTTLRADTGSGLHSNDGILVLKDYIRNWSKSRRHFCKEFTNGMYVQLRLN